MEGYPPTDPETGSAEDDELSDPSSGSELAESIYSGVMEKSDPLLHPQEAADLLETKTVTLRRLANEGKLGCTRTIGGHRRYDRTQIEAIRNLIDRYDPESEKTLRDLGLTRLLNR